MLDDPPVCRLNRIESDSSKARSSFRMALTPFITSMDDFAREKRARPGKHFVHHHSKS